MKFDDENKVARLSLSSEELLKILHQREDENPNGTAKKTEIHFFLVVAAYHLSKESHLQYLFLCLIAAKQLRFYFIHKFRCL